MGQNTAIRTTGRTFDFLEPAINPEYARTDHVMIVAAGSGTTVAYAKGQVLAQKDDGTNVFAKLGTSGYTGPKRIVKYPFVINDAQKRQYGTTWNDANQTFEGSVDVYWRGYFKTQDLTPSGLTDAATAAVVGNIIRGTRTAGIIELNAATPVAPA